MYDCYAKAPLYFKILVYDTLCSINYNDRLVLYLYLKGPSGGGVKVVSGGLSDRSGSIVPDNRV